MPPKILLVEDEIDIQGFAKTVLESAGMAVTACQTIAEGGKLFESVKPDLVILDIGLPDGSGIDFCRSLIAQHGGRTPILVLTARRDLPTRLDAFKAGAQDYIEKPFAVQELLARVQVHLKLKKSHDDLSKRNYDLELTSRARQDLTDMILHDLKTPLSSIKGTLELIKMRGIISDKAYSGLVDHAGTAADFMLLMLNDLLDIAQSEQLSLRVSVAKFELSAMAERIEGLFEPRLRSLGVSLDFRIDPAAASVETDQNLIFRVMVNVISNALRVSPRGGKVEVEARASEGKLRLAVSDRGPGVADDLKAKIFEKFVTTHGGASLESGRGIGLTFCRLAVDALKGSISVRDREGGGSHFVIEVPQSARAKVSGLKVRR
jgi:signal transduction histidine kinase